MVLFRGRCLLHHRGIENDQAIFFHVTAGNVKFIVCSESMTNFCSSIQLLYETRLCRGNAILEVLYSRLTKFIRDSRIWVDRKASDFVLS